MPLDLSVQDPLTAALEAYAPERYWALWQIPEGRYAYSVGLRREAWLILLDAEENGLRCLLDDARNNGRDPTQYRLDELTLPDAFDAARAQPLPFVTSFGTTVKRVLGVELRTGGVRGTRLVRQIPI